MAGLWIPMDEGGANKHYYGANGKNVADLLNGKLYVYDPANFNASDPDVQRVVMAAQPQIASPQEVMQVQDPHGPGNGEGGSDLANIMKGIAFVGGGALATGGFPNLTGATGAGAGGAGSVNAAIDGATSAAGWGAPNYEAAAAGVDGMTGGAAGAAGGAAAGAGALAGLTPQQLQMLASLGITGAGALAGGGAGGVGGGGVPANLLSLIGPALGIGGGIAALTGSGQIGTAPVAQPAPVPAPSPVGIPGAPGYSPTGVGQVDQTLQQLLQAIYTQAADPQQALYGRTLQQGLDTGRAGQAARGLGVSPVGQQLENQQTNNFNIDWQNNLLSRMASSLPGLQNYFSTGTSTLNNTAQFNADQARQNAQFNVNAGLTADQINANNRLATAQFNAGQQQKGVQGLTTGLGQLSTLANVPGSWLNTLFSGGGGGSGGGTGGAPVGGSNDVNSYPTFTY